ncbi:unnamed protein product [Effrenium voratum]|nr:unnamed protein product [Effrenium voratum]
MDPFRPVQVLEVQERIESLSFAGGHLYVGTAVGNLLQYSLSNGEDSARPVGQVRLSARRAVEQVCATGGFVFVLLDGVLSALPGNVQSSAPVELCKDVKHMCLHTGDAGTNAEVCAATRKKLVLFAHNGMTFEQRQEFPTSEAAAALAWHGPLICAGFRPLDKVGQSFFHFGTTSDAPNSTFRSLQRAWIARDSGIRSGAMVAKEAIALETQLHRDVFRTLGGVGGLQRAGPKAAERGDVHVMLCEGLPEGPAPNIKAAGLPGLFDDLPEMVSGPSLPQAEPQKEALDCLFAVFDGHGGAAAARACAERVPTEIREELDAAGRDTSEARRVAVQGTYLALDRHLRIKLGPAARECGTTCVFGYVWREEKPGKFGVLLANLGDSRGLLLKSSRNGDAGSVIRSRACYEVAAQTKDHTPNAPEEEKRIKAAGGKVEVFPGSRVPVMRVDGFLGCSRALGDFRFKEDAALLPEQQKVSAVPEVYEFEAEAGDAIVLACDGVFDVLSSDKVAALVSPGLQKKEPSAAATAVVQAALADPRQQDNVTCVVALLQ